VSKVYYCTRYSYVSCTELNFLKHLNRKYNVTVIIKNQRLWRNVTYLCKVKFLLILENLMQSIFSLSRNYQSMKLVNLKSSFFNLESEREEYDGKIIFFQNDGLYIADQFEFNLHTKNLLSLIDKIGGAWQNHDQIKLDIYTGAKNQYASVFTAYYERDRFLLNGNIIFLRRALHHAQHTKNLF
jgi:hypothetical protein